MQDFSFLFTGSRTCVPEWYNFRTWVVQPACGGCMTRVRRSAGTSRGCYEHLVREDKIYACRKEILRRRPDEVEGPCMFMYCMAGNRGKSSGERPGCRRLLKKTFILKMTVNRVRQSRRMPSMWKRVRVRSRFGKRQGISGEGYRHKTKKANIQLSEYRRFP